MSHVINHLTDIIMNGLEGCNAAERIEALQDFQKFARQNLEATQTRGGSQRMIQNWCNLVEDLQLAIIIFKEFERLEVKYKKE